MTSKLKIYGSKNPYFGPKRPKPTLKLISGALIITLLGD
jgi:hypothetical protein